ncbi:MAG: histidine phosphatase family protein [Ruminococcus sp.]|nr:histidine phosphatase family protein [Ruminococcus sp.]
MMIYLIRHGLTAGNLEKRYIGRTDEPLCQKGIEELSLLTYPRCGVLVCSPMKRCIQTAELLFPGQELHICEGLRECDFGSFEGKNYAELSGDPDYQRWIDSQGEMRFPGGESPDRFRKRCTEAFIRTVSAYSGISSLAFVVHGGTIMSILEKFALPHRSYYDWHTENGHGWLCRYDGGKITIPEKL